MSQHDYDIANGSGAAVRADINALAGAIATQNSGAAAPSVTFANMLWYDTTNSKLKIRNPGNTAWIDVFSISGSTLSLLASSIPNDFVTAAMMANMADSTIRGRAVGAGTGDPQDLTGAQVAAILGAVIDAIDGLTPAAGKFIRFTGSNAAVMADIVGTVSQSSGVPTGAIVEQGANSNGRYVKWADGTMICYIGDTVGGTTSTASGSVFLNDETSAWTFPAAFAGTADIAGFASPKATSRWATMRAMSTTTGTIRQYSSVTSATTVTCFAFGIGRWY